jgi:exosortase E/protease (VPEID-CTERM system)
MALERLRWLCLITVPIIEFIWISSRFESWLFAQSTHWLALPFTYTGDLLRIGIAFIGVFFLIISPHSKLIRRTLKRETRYHCWWIWLLLQILAFSCLIAISPSLRYPSHFVPPDFVPPAPAWVASWLTLAVVALGLWMIAIAPVRFWMQLVCREYLPLLMGIFAATVVWIFSSFAQELWEPLAELTLRFVQPLLHIMYADSFYQPYQSILGTPDFQVRIDPACSGYEGIALVSVFLAVYLWLFRHQLRFPQVLLLFPLGIIAIWLANVLRIVVLIVIGSSISPEIAISGFHRQAGWIGFTCVALGLIFLSHRSRYFTTQQRGFESTDVSSPAVPLLVPFVVLMATSMLTAAFSDTFDALYPLRVMVVAGVLWCFRSTYLRFSWSWSWPAVAIGVAVFLMWVAFAPNANPDNSNLANALAELPYWIAVLWLIFRALGSAITVPLAEELAFRGYLLRKLIAWDFEKVSFKQFTWFSFLLSSLLFGLLHGRWLAGTLAGMAYALAVYRRGQLSDAIVAHMTTNALLAVYVLIMGKWSLWS